MTTDLQGLQKIVSITTRNNIKLIPLTCSYAQQLALGIGMSDERANAIPEVIRVVLTRHMTYAYQGIGESTLDIFVGLYRLKSWAGRVSGFPCASTWPPACPRSAPWCAIPSAGATTSWAGVPERRGGGRQRPVCHPGGLPPLFPKDLSAAALHTHGGAGALCALQAGGGLRRRSVFAPVEPDGLAHGMGQSRGSGAVTLLSPALLCEYRAAGRRLYLRLLCNGLFGIVRKQKTDWATQLSREKVLPCAKKSVDIPRRDG